MPPAGAGASKSWRCEPVSLASQSSATASPEAGRAAARAAIMPSAPRVLPTAARNLWRDEGDRRDIGSSRWVVVRKCEEPSPQATWTSDPRDLETSCKPTVSSAPYCCPHDIRFLRRNSGPNRHLPSRGPGWAHGHLL